MEPKKHSMNLNHINGLHRMVYNGVKKQYKEDFKQTLEGMTFQTPIRIEYTYYSSTRRKSDVANWCAPTDKFFSDALTEWGCIEDDNYLHLVSVEYNYGGYDKNKGRVEITIKEV